MITAQLPDASSIQRTDAMCRKIEKILSKVKAIDNYTTITGYSMMTNVTQPNAATFFVSLKPWEERKSIRDWSFLLILLMNKEFIEKIPEAQVYAYGPPAIQGLGSGAGFSFVLQDKSGNTPQDLEEQAQRFIAAAKKRPEIGRIATFYRSSVPQVFADINMDKAMKLGVSISDVNNTLGALLGSAYINDFNKFGRVYKVFISAEGEYRDEVRDLNDYYLRSKNGDMVPLNTLVTMRKTSGPDFTNRFNLYRSAEITGVPATGYSSTQALDALKETAAQVLPQGWGYDWTNMSYQEIKAAGAGAIIFVFALLFVFLILAAQYESWSLPLSVLLGTPFALLGAMLGIFLARFISPFYVNNVFAQIGFITLIGLSAKNAILIVEFAKSRKEEGAPVVEAALSAAKLRLRPILMTSFAFILGVFPLVRASGAGAEARKVMGLAVFTGLLVATSLAIFIIPTLYVMVEKYLTRSKSKTTELIYPEDTEPLPRKENQEERIVMRNFIFLLMILVFAAGCSVGPNYHRPSVDVPQQWIHGEILTTTMDKESKDMADTAWWELFGDPVLTELITTALKNNNDIRIAAARVDEYMGAYGVAKSDYFPKFGGTASASYGRSATYRTRDGKWAEHPSYSIGVSTSWEIDIWGKIRRANEAARADLLTADEARREMVLLITSQIAGSYIQLLTLDRQLVIAKETADSHGKSLDLFKLRRAKGDISDLTLSQLETEYWYAMSRIPLIEKNISQTEHALSVLLGKNPGAIKRGATLLTLKIPDVPEGIPSTLLERRPDIRQAEEQLIAANARIGVAKSQYFPSISLTGAFGTASSDFSTLFNPASIIFNIGGNLLQPIFRAGEIYNQVKASEAVQRQSLYNYVKTVQTAFQDTEDALVDRTRTFEQFNMEVNRIKSLGTYARLSRMRFNEGISSYIEVLDSERALFSAELDHAQTHGQLLGSIVHIYKALAGGWLDKAAANSFQPMYPADKIKQKDREKREKEQIKYLEKKKEAEKKEQEKKKKAEQKEEEAKMQSEKLKKSEKSKDPEKK